MKLRVEVKAQHIGTLKMRPLAETELEIEPELEELERIVVSATEEAK